MHGNKHTQMRNHPRSDYDAFANRYITEIVSDIGKLNGQQDCARRALGILLTEFGPNIRGCYHGLWNSVEHMEYSEFEKKVAHDTDSNKRHISSRAPEGCAGRFVEKFSQKIYAGIQKEVMDYASR